MSLTYHNYKDDTEIAVDIETKDPNLKEKGNGVYRKDGFIIGVSFSNGDLSEYYPMRHPDTTPEEVLRNCLYVDDQLSSNNHKIFANGLYDLDWLINYDGIKVKGAYDDVQIAEPLLDEYRNSYSLNNLSISYLEEGKKYDGVREYAIQQEWIKAFQKSNGIEHLWRMPQDIAKEYASEDARLTYEIFQKQKSKLEDQNLTKLYNLEMRLYPLLLQMRKAGVRVSEEELYSTGRKLTDMRFDLVEDINNIAGFKVNVNSNKDLEELFNRLGIPIVYKPPTENMMSKGLTRGNPSFDKNTLKRINNPITKEILELKHIKTLINLFIHPYPELLVDGRLHCQFNQLRSDEYGTVSGRFSSSKPNLQQVSDTKEDIGDGIQGKIIRKLFKPEEGHHWLKLDWSQIEFRLIAHYAIGEGSEEIRKRYNEDPNIDYHVEIGKMAGLSDRDESKCLNFGTAYGMGIELMANNNNWALDYARSVHKQYHKKVPFIKETSARVARKAKRIGFIRTILNRRARLRFSNKAYTMFNRLIQGSSADLMKISMVNAYEANIFDTLIPHLTVHDELDNSMPKTKEGIEAGKELINIMENCVKLKIPIKVDAEIGPNWGELKPWEV